MRRWLTTSTRVRKAVAEQARRSGRRVPARQRRCHRCDLRVLEHQMAELNLLQSRNLGMHRMRA